MTPDRRYRSQNQLACYHTEFLQEELLARKFLFAKFIVHLNVARKFAFAEFIVHLILV
jgi:hypothetical protein